MIDWFEYYKKKHLESKKAMMLTLLDMRRNPFCSKTVIIKLCRWFDKRTEDMLVNTFTTTKARLEFKATHSSYQEFLDFVGDL